MGLRHYWKWAVKIAAEKGWGGGGPEKGLNPSEWL